MAMTDKIREKLLLAQEVEDGVDVVATHLRGSSQRKAEALRQEALTLAICALLDSGLVLADPAEVRTEGT